MSTKKEKLGYIRTLIASTEIWHVNFAASIAVIIFVYWQLHSIFAKRERRQRRNSVMPQRDDIKNDEVAELKKTQKKFVDKEVFILKKNFSQLNVDI